MDEKGKKNLATAISFFDDAENAKGWDHCKQYCTEDATFEAQSGAFHPPYTAANLGGHLEGFVEWIAIIGNQISPGCYNTGMVRAYDSVTDTAIIYGCYHGTHTNTPKECRWKFPEPTNRSVASDFVYKLHFNSDGKIDGMVKIWNSEWWMKGIGWINNSKANLANAVAFFDDAESGKGWSHCKRYCTEDATFSGQSGAFHPPYQNADLGGRLEGFVEWIGFVVTKVCPDAYNTGIVNAYDESTDTAVIYGCFNGTHTNTPEGSKLPSPTNKFVTSDFIYKLHFNQDGKIEGMVKIWNSEWFMRGIGWTE